MNAAEIAVVVEVNINADLAWVPLPPRPWPTHVHLRRAANDRDVALFFGTLCSSTRSATSVRDLLTNFPQVLSGGVAVVAHQREVLPSCCCGLEHWREWQKVLPTGESPWTGHDPAPLVERTTDAVLVWSDGGMGGKPNEDPVVFTHQDFERALHQASDELFGFLAPLEAWLKGVTPEHAQSVVHQFSGAFLDEE